MAGAGMFPELDAALAKVRALPNLVRDVVPAAAEALDAELRANIAAGRGPDGEAWQLTQAGKQPLQHAGKALTVLPSGGVVVARVTGPEALHHLGGARGGIARRILPSRGVPAGVQRALQAVVLRLLGSS